LKNRDVNRNLQCAPIAAAAGAGERALFFADSVYAASVLDKWRWRGKSPVLLKPAGKNRKYGVQLIWE
jgi:hypothetical protein